MSGKNEVHKPSENKQDDQQKLIANATARLIAVDGLREYGKAKRRALHQLNLPDSTPLPSNGAIDIALHEYISLYQDEEQRARITYLRQVAAEVMEKFAKFAPYLTGSVLEGTAGRFAEIDIQLFPDSSKEVEIFLLDQGLSYEHSEPRSERAEAVLSLDVDDARVNLVIYPYQDERVTFRTRDGRIARHCRLDVLKKLIDSASESISA